MGKKDKGEYNDFLEGEKLRDNAEVRTSLHRSSALDRDVSPPATRRDKKGRGKKGKGGPKKPQLTHFLCLPLVNEQSRPQLEKSVEKLKKELQGAGLVPLKAVRPVGTLHLTLGVMSLNAAKLEEAAQTLQDLDLRSMLRDISTQIVAEKAAEDGTISENFSAAALPDSGALSVELEGLLPMQAPHKTSVVYAEPKDASQRLYPFGFALKDLFAKKGLIIEQFRTLKLHATIINTVYAKPEGRGGRNRNRKKPNHREPGPAAADPAEGPEVEEADDGESTAGSTQDADEAISAPPDPSTGETNVKQVDRSEGHGPNAKSWMRFDARELIEQSKEVVWAEAVRIDRVQICKMGAKKIFDESGEIVDEVYEVAAEKII